MSENGVPGPLGQVPLSADAMAALLMNEPSGAGPVGVLQVQSVLATSLGLHVRFNQAIDPGRLTARAVLVMRGDELVRGRLVADPDGEGFRFVAEGGELTAGEYRVVLTADLGAFVTLAGEQLDGDFDGRPGGDYRGRFSVPVGRPGINVSAAMLHGGLGGALSLALGPAMLRRRAQHRNKLGHGEPRILLGTGRHDDLAFAVPAMAPATLGPRAEAKTINDWEIRL